MVLMVLFMFLYHFSFLNALLLNVHDRADLPVSCEKMLHNAGLAVAKI